MLTVEGHPLGAPSVYLAACSATASIPDCPPPSCPYSSQLLPPRPTTTPPAERVFPVRTVMRSRLLPIGLATAAASVPYLHQLYQARPVASDHPATVDRGRARRPPHDGVVVRAVSATTGGGGGGGRHHRRPHHP